MRANAIGHCWDVKPTTQKDPKAMRDVWTWKEAKEREVQDLPVDKASAKSFP
jgi:hypothetical protein